MASMTIPDIDDELKARLRFRAAQHGVSMEEEARSILQASLSGEPLTGRVLLRDIRALVEPFGGVDIVLPPRGPMRHPADFGE